jgi:hypothetical protein
MIFSTVYDITYHFINNSEHRKLTINNGKPRKITALRRRAVDIVCQMLTDSVFKENARILEIASSDRRERYTEPGEIGLFVIRHAEVTRVLTVMQRLSWSGSTAGAF